MNTIRMLARYKAWANTLTYTAVSELPPGEAVRERKTRYRNIVHTLNHVYVIDAVFKAHLLGREHGYHARNTPEHPPLAELWDAARTLDAWYVEHVDAMPSAEWKRPITFSFIGGGSGRMTAEQMIAHVVNHGTYHRGLVADMMYQAGVTPPATDLPVFLRDVA